MENLITHFKLLLRQCLSLDTEFFHTQFKIKFMRCTVYKNAQCIMRTCCEWISSREKFVYSLSNISFS